MDTEVSWKQKIVLTVRGVHYETLAETLQYYPSTLLGKLSNQLTRCASNGDIIILDCSTLGFEAVLFYYQSQGILVCPPGLLLLHFEQLCRYFKLPEHDIQRMKKREGYIFNTDKPTKVFTSCQQRRLWEFLERPFAGNFSKLFAVFNYAVILFSIILPCITTSASFAESKKSSTIYDFSQIGELVLSITFGVEYALRLLASPVKTKFIVSPLNVIDLLSFLPYILCVPANCVNSGAVLGFVRTARVVKLFKLTRASSTFHKTFMIISHCLADIATLTLSIFISAVFCGSVVFFAEMSLENTQFTSIAQSIWWAIQTIVPVGYGDIVPIGWLGKCLGAAAAIFSSLAFTVPLLFIGGKFLMLYFVNCGSAGSSKLSAEQIYEFKRGIILSQSNEADIETKLIQKR